MPAWVLWALAYLAVGSVVGGFVYADMARSDPNREHAEKNVRLTFSIVFLWPVFGPVYLATTLGEWLLRRGLG